MEKVIPLFIVFFTSSAYAAIQNPPVFKNSNAQSNVVSIDLKVTEKQGEMYNPSSNLTDKVILRQYIDPNNPLKNQFVAPTIQVKQDSVLNVNLINQLPLYEYKNAQGKIEKTPICRDAHNTIGCINTTNLHTHGLHVNPGYTIPPNPNKPNDRGLAADNVFIKINPQEQQQYQFHINKDHPAGTYWYHAHLHGSTALQVTSGMAGALIVEGNRTPFFDGKSFNQVGDFDVLWKAKGLKEALSDNMHVLSPDENNDLVTVFQQIQYVCGNQEPYKTTCLNNQIGHLQGDVKFINNDNVTDTLLSPSGWKNSGRYTSINGNVLGEIALKQNEYYRWRMIHGGVRDTIGLRIYRLENAIPRDKKQEFIAACQKAASNGVPIDYAIVAQDGITTNSIQITNGTLLQPGYRYDAILKFHQDGQYCVMDNDNFSNAFKVNANLTAESLNAANDPAKVLAMLHVNSNSKETPPFKDFLKAKVDFIKQSNGQALDERTKAKIKSDIDQNLLTGFAPFASLQNAQIEDEDKQSLTFSIKDKDPQNLNKKPDIAFAISNAANDYDAARAYGENQINRYLRLNKIGEWKLTSRANLKIGDKPPYQLSEPPIGHPFHIHVNSFQIQSVYKTGDARIKQNDITLQQGTNPLFNGLNGIWKDTLFIPAGYEVIVRTKYEDFTGDFVLHCHILDHEDQGMMQNVRICDLNDKDCKTRPFGYEVPKALQSHTHTH
ncbi:multicopper oxidase domain-containing protein [Acinetobacter sp. 194]|uniref:multicopper oxidase family protein n=1 Tax=Acinetobacter shaoyimingii TaxID=2715164 RepID=UPI00140D8092|nr:multicopper oxidase domain-containing protein [Acinetobacter shaoyimingii]NHB57180.1 multicopper oxidase domain-containing protein [Acinetobacter shaoyimingii]